MSLSNAMTDTERDRLIAKKNKTLGLILLGVVAGGLLVAYLTRFVLWHIVFAK
jgi:hypothetical protein